VTSKTDETARDRHISVHLSDRVVGETENHGVESCADEETARATFGQTGTDTDEQTSTNSASYSEELNLTIVETAMKAISITTIILDDGAGALGPLGGLFRVGGHVGDDSAELLLVDETAQNHLSTSEVIWGCEHVEVGDGDEERESRSSRESESKGIYENGTHRDDPRRTQQGKTHKSRLRHGGGGELSGSLVVAILRW
jgi:hypothetical protein